MRITSALQAMAIAGLLSCSPAVEPPERTILEAALKALHGEVHGGSSTVPHTHLLLGVPRPDPWSGCGAALPDEPAVGIARGSDDQGAVAIPRKRVDCSRSNWLRPPSAARHSCTSRQSARSTDAASKRDPGLQTETFRSYASRNRDLDPEASVLVSLKLGATQFDVLPYRRYVELTATGPFWSSIEREYGGPVELWIFSQVGLNPARTQALLFIALQSGMHVGEGRFVLLTREMGAWQVVRTVQAYVI